MLGRGEGPAASGDTNDAASWPTGKPDSYGAKRARQEGNDMERTTPYHTHNAAPEMESEA